MSRASKKSELSPTITKGSDAIDLGRDSAAVDMGRKSQPSLSSGGIGVTSEVADIGGLKVTGGVSADISPINLGINYDPSENAVTVTSGAELPGGLLGVSGGVTVDIDTGEISGGSLGGEAVGFGVNVSASNDGELGIEFTVQIPFTPIEISLGFGFSPKKPPSPKPSPAPSPTNNPQAPSQKNCGSFLWIYTLYCPAEYWHTGAWAATYSADRACIIQNEWSRRMYDGDNGNNKNKLTAAREGAEGYNAPGTGREMLTLSFSRTHVSYGEPVLNRYSSPPHFPTTGASRDSRYINYEKLCRIKRVQHMTVFYSSAVPVVARQGYPCDYEPVNPEQWWYRSSVFAAHYSEWTVEYLEFPPCPEGDPPKLPDNTFIFEPSSFPNPPPRRRNKMEDCCKENLRFLRAIYTGLGIAKFPGKLPATIIQEISKEGEEAPEPPQVPIKDFVDLLSWQFERDDERWGQWEIQIDIKDSDITKEGDQKKSVKFPNLAESVAELEGQILSLMTNVDALVALQIKNLAESGMARQEAIKGYLAAKAIIKYMAFKAEENDVPVPMTFTAGAETISELLKESEGHIKGTDYTETETFRDVCLDLLQAAAIIRATHWQRIDTKTDTKSQLLNILKGSVDLAASIAKPKSSNEVAGEKTFDPEKNFEDFLDSVEDGFRNSTGITDIQNPYGKSPDRRPRIRQIGDNISQAGGTD